MRGNRNGHSLWTFGPRPGACRFCGEHGVDEARTCAALKPRVAAREAREIAATAARGAMDAGLALEPR
jgi:hypothetical protein